MEVFRLNFVIHITRKDFLCYWTFLCQVSSENETKNNIKDNIVTKCSICDHLQGQLTQWCHKEVCRKRHGVKIFALGWKWLTLIHTNQKWRNMDWWRNSGLEWNSTWLLYNPSVPHPTSIISHFRAWPWWLIWRPKMEKSRFLIPWSSNQELVLQVSKIKKKKSSYIRAKK